MAMTELDRIVDDYLAQLEVALAPLSASRRIQIVAEISEHVSQARMGLSIQDEASIRALFERIGTPREIAASALSEGVPTASHRGRLKWGTEGVLIGTVLLLVVIGAIVYFAQSGSSTVTVPNVIGSVRTTAQRIISDSGLQYHVAARPFGSEVSGPLGSVVAQFPPAGTLESSGSSVTLDVSGVTTPPSATVPNVVGESVTSAFKQLRAKGFGGGYGSSCGRGDRACELGNNLVVVAQYPFAATRVPIGTNVSLDVQSPARAARLGVIDGTLVLAGSTSGLAQPVSGTVWISDLASHTDPVETIHVALSGSFSRVLPSGAYELSATIPASSNHPAATCASRAVTAAPRDTTTVTLHCQPKS
jgi:hypothetical protein